MKTALGALVRLFPKAFREHFGDAIVEHALLDWERDRRRGRLAGARSFARTVFDLVRARSRSGCGPPGPTSRPKKEERP